MNARRLLLLLALLLLGSLVATAAPAPADDFQPWKPELSWQGGAQYDPRLEQPVKFWRAGLTLGEVFAGIEQQTGVKLDFSPPDDENARVPVNLFLNEKAPPGLRALMAQLSWATECVFFYRGEEGKQTYSLMRTSLGEGAAARIEKESAQAYQEAEAVVKAMPAKLEEIKEALKLPRDEAIERYRGKDDFLLLTAFDPKRRAAAEFATRWCQHAFDTLTVPASPNTVSSTGSSMQANLPPEDRELLEIVFDGAEYLFTDGDHSSWKTMADSGGGLSLRARSFPPGDPHAVPFGAEPHIDILDPAEKRELTPEHQVALEGLLGETRTPEEQKQRVEEVRAERTAQKDTQEKTRRKAYRALSVRAAELLSSTMLDHAAPFWRVQEEVAKATGMNVVADALWEHVLGGAVIPPEGEHAQTPALSALECFTSAYLVYPRPQGVEPARWEWGDAGSFLRFRAPERDVWRAARLPQGTLDWADGLVAPYLPKQTDAGDRPKSVDMKLQVVPEQWFRALGRLNDLQLRYGGEESYGDPEDPAVALRVAVLRAALPHGGMSPEITRLLGQLDEEQWRALKGEGLNSTSFNANQREVFARYVGTWRVKAAEDRPVPTEARLTMRGGDIVPPEGDKAPVFDGSQYAVSVSMLGRTERGLVPVGVGGGGQIIPTVVEVHVDLPASAGMIYPACGYPTN